MKYFLPGSGSKCRHENADHLMPGDLLDFDEPHSPPWPVTVEQFRCLDCGYWLPLGPANDEEHDIRQEARAAELAVLYVERGTVIGTQGERDGFNWFIGINKGWMPERGASDWAADCWTGYLAAAIATHDDNTRASNGGG